MLHNPEPWIGSCVDPDTIAVPKDVGGRCSSCTAVKRSCSVTAQLRVGRSLNKLYCSCVWWDLMRSAHHHHHSYIRHTNMYTCTRLCTHTHARTHTCTYRHMYARTHTHTHAHRYIYAHIHTHMHACTHTHTHANTHMYAHTHTHTHTHTHVCLHTCTHTTHTHTYVRRTCFTGGTS